MHIFFSVGEPNGDAHAAKLIEENRRLHVVGPLPGVFRGHELFCHTTDDVTW